MLFIRGDHSDILLVFASFTWITSGFIFDSTCPKACSCGSSSIQCGSLNLSKVPAFERLDGQNDSVDVVLSNNQLTTIPAYAFASLSAVYTTDISIILINNHIFNIDVNAFGGVETSVRYINLHKNSLTHIPLAFAKLSSLYSLILSRNPLVSLDVSVLANLSTTLSEFYISIGLFSNIPDELRFLKSLSILTMYNVSSSAINSTICQKCENLGALELSYSNFDRFPVGVCSLNSLRYLDSRFSPALSRNATFMFDACNNSMPNITTLVLRNDQLSTLPKLGHIFPRLEFLDLSGNALHFIKNSSFSGLTALTYLDLRNNLLTRIPRALLRLNHLRNFYLGGKPIVCSCHTMGYLKSWNVRSIDLGAYCSPGIPMKTYLTTELPKCS